MRPCCSQAKASATRWMSAPSGRYRPCQIAITDNHLVAGRHGRTVDGKLARHGKRKAPNI